MPSQPESTIVCTHERRPGTTVCLHCRHEARLAAQAKRKRLLLRGSAVSAAVLAVFVVGALGAMALRGRVQAPHATPRPQQVVAVNSAPDTTATIATATVATVKQQGDLAPPSRAPLAPVLSQGRTTFADGTSAERTDSMVTLSFDTPMLRTRIPEKFERYVRATLPKIYGARADSALARLPDGGIAGQGNLLYDLPSRGVHIPLDSRWSIALYPETRPGEDGPLVVRCRVLVVAQQD